MPYLCTGERPHSDVRYSLRSVIFLLAYYLPTVRLGLQTKRIPQFKHWLILLEQ